MSMDSVVLRITSLLILGSSLERSKVNGRLEVGYQKVLKCLNEKQKACEKMRLNEKKVFIR